MERRLLIGLGTLSVLCAVASAAVVGYAGQQERMLHQVRGGVNDKGCYPTPIPSYVHDCACETGSTIFGCSKSQTDPVTRYECLAWPDMDCTLSAQSCGGKLICNPRCDVEDRQCNDAMNSCSSNTTLGYCD